MDDMIVTILNVSVKYYFSDDNDDDNYLNYSDCYFEIIYILLIITLLNDVVTMNLKKK